ncbi:MAG: SAM-dependent methyltransferase [Clostridia bacterium]|nr:SAM-dependent methyltransferase [Clostridia bacterium]
MVLTKRLERVYKYLEAGDTVIDVGCDHAYLAIKLLFDGKYNNAVLTDIAPLPLETAKENASDLFPKGNFKFCLCDGLSCVGKPDGDYAVAICGMGGEMIADILGASPDVAKDARVIVLQPMTKQNALREFLWNNGYSIVSDDAVEESKHIYTVITARYKGDTTAYDDFEPYIGKRASRVVSTEVQRALERFHGQHKAIRHGVLKSGGDASFENSLVSAAEKEINYIREMLK